MFRDSDYQPPRLHDSFAKKPISVMQLQTQLSHLEVPEKRLATVNDVAPAPVRATHDSIYDPTHPDADWAGLVHRTKGTRKHEQGHKSQAIGIVHSEDGIVSKEEKAEFQRKRRDLAAHSEDTGYILGGVLDKNHVQYMTDMQRGNAGIRTEAEQIVLARRPIYKHGDGPARRGGAPGSLSGPPSSRGSADSMMMPRSQAAGSLQAVAVTTAPKGSRGSLLTGLADSLVHNESLQLPGTGSEASGSVSNPRSIYGRK